ncbi:MAG TPA: glycosyl transferase [Pseudomonas sp.]|uniref:glycosyltransferase family 2 protein n=1 Tax=Stutzerimonas frequens TaxID=2968969 RepID=UPI000E84E0E7|nr:glycosyltransferase family 2 protein [Stutzerimonas frequens]MBA4726504.1 glycosyltransferase family 2 protein [Pseudomonas sp.]MBK3873795.1 glycosyltransferase [Stutzerimonas frequens]MBK3912064.1 glycosyltransferase [Stutzerimonas frequens]MBK3918984.1 glycosyltransferase [Stutzerimonas frequens]MBK3931347.1 glycosyltransferase [Stutzerimonas frequens]
MTDTWLWWLQVAFILYFLLLNGMYLLLNVLSMASLTSYIRQRAETGELAPYLGVEPPVSVLMPAFNEEATIRTSVRSMLQLQYPEFEIVVINDGSKDNTLAVLIEEFDLVPHPEPLRQAVAHQPVQAIYRSRRYANLRVVDKANGGKADALNAGINAARYGLFCGVDADSILQRDSLLRVVQPFLEDERTIAAGGTVRIANGSQVRGGFLIQAGLPGNWLARFQIVEYLRAFLFGRLGWSPLNAVLIISGAFGLFDRERVMAVGGYRTDTVGEDMELVVRLHRYHREKRIPYRIRYLPDPICWTECPEDLGTLGRQRSRWQRGLAESLSRHARLAFSLRGGTPGWLAWPFMALFEWIGPLIELVGYGFMLAGFAFGAVSYAALAAFLLVAIGMGILLSVNGLLLETMSFRVYSRRRDMLQLFLMAVLENFGYRQLNTLWRCRGLWQWFSRRKHQWGVMRRSGQWGQS